MKLAMSGSGVKYPLHLGGYKALIESGIEIDEMSGVSGGAIVAGLLGSGYSPDEAIELARRLMPSNFIDGSIFNLKSYGYIKGDLFEREFEKYMAPTLGDTTIPLNIGVVSVHDKTSYFFNSYAHPNVSLPAIIRASMSIPFVFVPKTINGITYIDGGVGNNMPIDLFEPSDAIGFRVLGDDEKPRKPDSFKQFVTATISALMDAADRRHIQNYDRVINLKSATNNLNFWVTEEDFDRMIEEGYGKVRSIAKDLIQKDSISR